MSANETGLPSDLAFELIYEKKVLRLPPATDAQIAAVEARFGRPSPADYKRFLQSVNGGAPKACEHGQAPDPTDDPTECVMDHPDHHAFRVECFYGLGSEHYDVEDYSKRPSRASSARLLRSLATGSVTN
jgi:hypothetical protein